MGQAFSSDSAFIMPEGKRISLAVLQGADAGQIFPIEKPVFTMGRSEADLVLNDSEVSRLHAQIEIAGNAIVLKDLKSTNGTYVNEQRISVTPLEHQSEFRVGTTTLMLIVTDELS
jgi:pSer/pThr/pTyr-binding forkhead associated (FHA) protein